MKLPKVGETWRGTYKYVESNLIDIHDVEILSIMDDIVKFKRLDSGEESIDIVYGFIEWFKKINFQVENESSKI